MVEQLTENTFYFNCYPTVGLVVTADGVIAIDGPMKPNDAIKWRDFISTKGPLRYQVVTEHHQDHIASAWYLKPETIISSEITYAEFYKSIATAEDAKDRMLKYDPDCTPLLEGFEMRPPDVTFKERMTIRLGGRTFHLIHAPGHTRGETIVHAVEDRVAFVSDNLSTPENSVAFHSADVWGWFQTLGMMEALEVDWFVPGHGDPCKKDAFQIQREKMLGIISFVKELKNEGLTREEVQSRLEDSFMKKFNSPKLGARLAVLQKGGLGNIYDYLDDHPSGGLCNRMDPVWPNV